MALTVDSSGTALTQQQIARLRAEQALAQPVVAPVPPPAPEPVATGPIELPAMVDRRPAAPLPAPAPATASPAQPAPAAAAEPAEALDAVYTANGGQLGRIVEGYAQRVGILQPPDPFLPTLPSAPSTPEARLAGDLLGGSRGGAASGTFTALQGLATQGRVDTVDVGAAVLAEGIDDIAAGVSRTAVVGAAGQFAAKVGPVALASTVIANANAVVQEGGTAASWRQAIVHVGFDVTALGTAAAVGTAAGGPAGAVLAVAGFTAYQIVGAPIKENVTKLWNGEQGLGETLSNSWNGAADNLAVTGDAIAESARGMFDTVGGWFAGK